MSGTVREPAVAGRFYPGDSRRLHAFLDEHLVRQGTMCKQHLRALIVPHAGYPYSGGTAAKGFNLLPTDSFKRIILIGPSHYENFRGICMAPHGFFKTPIGEMKVDTEAVDHLVSGDHRFTKRVDVHLSEHALEVELPFLQRLVPSAMILPIATGKMTMEDILDISRALLPFWDDETLLVISSDFTHYGDHFGYYPFLQEHAQEKLPQLDGGAIDCIKKVDCDAFLTYVEETGATICGRFGISVLLRMCELNGAPLDVELLEYTTSANITGDYATCVAYAAISLSRKE